RYVEEYIKKFGQAKWQEHKQAVERIWMEIEKRLTQLQTPVQKVYQDGLPVCGKEMELARDLAKKGSRNHQILLRLAQQGAELVGTEDPKLLKEELATISKEVGGERVSLEEYKKGVMERLEKRDDFIARRIDETLKTGETGILFIGMLHKVNTRLPKDIQVELFLDHLGQKEKV
ncbi:MAG TPA: hypothetical protein ACFYED_10675, partial [Candidatus Tripitaka californicus]|uniref:hypothetical protein n=1 Tax=Candidatus Tripitaka californicus TaxID=3367616 RepID=UPI0040295656